MIDTEKEGFYKLDAFQAKCVRSRRRYFARAPKSAKDVMADVLNSHKYGRAFSTRDLDLAIQTALESAVGPGFGRLIQVGGIRRGRLEIIVANSVVLQELAFQKEEILKQLNRTSPEKKIGDLRFRVGSIQPNDT